MAEFIAIPHHRKRKRRRRQDKPAIGARLILDDHLKGDIGILSEDLFAELFPAANTNQQNGSAPDEVVHVAISPAIIPTSLEDTDWTVVPVRPSSAPAPKTVQFSPSSPALQSFADALQRIAPSKLVGHRSGFEIRILDVVPLSLETVFVTLEGELAQRLENGEGTFHAEGARVNGKGKSLPSPALPEDRLTSAIRQALNSLRVVHVGDSFALPLPPHPITHMPPSRAKVMLCEPVAQGLLSPRSRIVITQTHRHSKEIRKIRSLPLDRTLNEVEEEAEDTANDQIFSAAEDRYKTDAGVEDESASASETELSSADNESLSDDSMEDMLSLQAPMLKVSNPSGISTLQAGTPLGGKTNGINSPGSVYSSFTTTTARGSGHRGRLFKAQGLMRALPEESLHPKPTADEDEEARVFVDVNSLAKIACFSGDWVKLEASAEPPASGTGLWGLGSFGGIEEEKPWRPVKIYGLPESYSHRPVSKIPKNTQDGRRLSFFESQIQKPSSPTVHLSPILLANLDSPTHLRLSPLTRHTTKTSRGTLPKVMGSSRPPFARELTLALIATPLSTDLMLQATLFSGLRRYLKDRVRVVKSGDMIGIPIDESLGRTLSQQSSTGDDSTLEEIDSSNDFGSAQSARATRSTGVAWFKVFHVSPKRTEATEDAEMEDAWGGAASIDAASTRIIKAAKAEKSRLPPTATSTWEYYLRLRHVPKFGPETLNTLMPEPRRQHVTLLRRRIRDLVVAATSPRSIHLRLQPLAILLVSTHRNIGKATIASRACADIGIHTLSVDAYDILSDGGSNGGDMKTEAILRLRADRVAACGPENCALLIRLVEVLTSERLATALKEILAESRVLIATTTDLNKVPDGVRALFTHELEMTAPDEGEREGILRDVVEDQGVSLAIDVDLSAVAVKTAALVAGDLVDVVDRALVAKMERLENLASENSSLDCEINVRDVQVAGGSAGRCLTKADFDIAVEAARKNFADAIGAPKIPNVSWDDVGGLSNVKDAVMETIQLPLERPELFSKGMKKRSGILFYGPPGTGKTLLAKAIATEFSLNFFSVKGPELLNMYIGESEANVRRVFQRARDARPCAVFFDELDSVAPKRGNQGDSGGVMDRIVSQLLAELDGMSDGEDGGGGVFVIGATNRPDLLDAALLRPGRFDKMLYLGVSDTHKKQLTIMEALTRKFTMHPNTSLRRVADTLPFTYTGADFYALCSDAMLKAVTRQASAVDEKIKQLPGGPVSTAYFFDHYATQEDIAVMVTEEDFMAAQKELIPSVSAKELEHYARVRKTFEAVDEKGKGASSSDGVVDLDGKVVTVASPRTNGKGKGKERLRDSDGGDDDDEGLQGKNGGGGGMNGGKGKGKAVDHSGGFRDSTYDDDEDLY